ncbi:MAG TPA: hypothetical protein VNW95_15320 [Mucilaginibacter sp.]|jgi:hypothetical protein|nr:hypothetical protein [Mucilaginibacter sp.]
MRIALISAFYMLCLTGWQTPENHAVQFDLSKIVNARPVTVVANHRLVTWTKGIDGNGLADGYLTQSAASFNGDKDAHALPDNPVFAANSSHPEIVLRYSNNDTLHNQACSITGEGAVQFAVPKAKYSAVFLALTSAEGASNLQIQLIYNNGTTTKDFVLPDYYQDIKHGDPNLCYLAHDLAKWGNKNNMTEKDHHNIDLLKIQADPARLLKAIRISKTKPGYLVFWAAVGVKI